MILEFNKELTKEELIQLGQLFPNTDIKIKYSVYSFVCEVEADCALDMISDEYDITLPQDERKEIIKEIMDQLGYRLENREFQTMAEKADEETRQILRKRGIIQDE